MKSINVNFLGTSRYWWAVLLVGILLVLGGFAYWFWPAAGYAVASQIFGWLLILAGIVQLCVAAGPNHAKGWGWWIAGVSSTCLSASCSFAASSSQSWYSPTFWLLSSYSGV